MAVVEPMPMARVSTEMKANARALARERSERRRSVSMRLPKTDIIVIGYTNSQTKRGNRVGVGLRTDASARSDTPSAGKIVFITGAADCSRVQRAGHFQSVNL